MTSELVVDAGDTRLVLGVGEDGRLHQLGFGPDADDRPELPIGLFPVALPTFGEEPLRVAALRITHADGATGTRLRHVGHSSEPWEHGVDHRVGLADRVAPVRVDLRYRTWPEHHVLEQWVEVTNGGDVPCTLHQAATAAPALGGSAPHLTHWGGGWAGEWTPVVEALTRGVKTVASAGGVRPSLHLPPIVLWSPDGKPVEDDGGVLAATVLWGGDTRFDAEVAHQGHHRLIVGTEHVGAERVLDPGATFATPHSLWTWSTKGVGETSRRLHRLGRDHLIRDGAGSRATVVNTWEAVGFDFDTEVLIDQVQRAAAVGGEVFLLDDGWFGGTHPRDDDTTSLGDWEVDRRKLPEGLGPVIDATREAGMRFGLWVEPEMVNPTSELYAAHPEWVIGQPGRERREERNQLVLDLCREEVRDFVVATVDRVLGDNPGITYLKWDANRDITEPGSGALPLGRQSHLPIDRVRATAEVMAEVARRHPDVELMLCASGGGRSDLGTLRWFHELWTSDDTDPVDRVRIQWGASHLLPASVLGAHVTRWGQRPIAFGCAVAMSGRFGLDLDLTSLTDEEMATCADAAAAYASIRDVVQHGDLRRLVSPVGGTRAALAHRLGDRTVVFLHRLPGDPGGGAPVVLPWIGTSDVAVVDLTPGRAVGDRIAELVDGGVPWPGGDAPCSTVLELVTDAV